MTSDETTRETPGGDGFLEPSEDVKRRNRITGLIIAGIIFAMIAIGMIVRVYGS
jgi:hypothetical protein